MTLPATILGRTGREVTRLGLGCGGPSRLGLKQAATREDAVAVVRAAIDMGVTFIDTAEAYTTEPQVAQAVRESGRDGITICTKACISDYPEHRTQLTAGQFRGLVDERLAALDTDCLDILLLHGVDPAEYDYCRHELVPALMDLRDAGKLRWFGFSEEFNVKPDHTIFDLAAQHDDDCWDVVMLGFNLLNQSARQAALPWAQRHNVGVLCMYAVRRVLSDAARLRQTIEKLVAEGQLDPAILDDDPLAFLVCDGHADSVTEASYRFALGEEGINVVLTGTGNVAHLAANVEAARKGPLAAEAARVLRERFGHVTGVSGN